MLFSFWQQPKFTKSPATVLSRCQRFEFRRIPAPIIVKKLQTLTKQENIDIEPEALNLIARQATGALRDAISLVDQLSSISKKVTLPIAQDLLGTATNQAVIDLTDAIIKQDQSRGVWKSFKPRLIPARTRVNSRAKPWNICAIYSSSNWALANNWNSPRSPRHHESAC